MTSTPLKTSDISIIIPALNEEENIPLLAHNLKGGEFEIILVDGGSTDRTIEKARQNSFAVVTSQPGRGHQLNVGARHAHGKILLFLHADTRLPKNFATSIIHTIESGKCIAGAFRLSIDRPTLAMRFIGACANIRSLVFQLPYGDQAIFIDRDTFFQLEMFPELPIMEDYAFIKNARRCGRIAVLKDAVITSARRWQRLGVFRTTIINQLIIIGFFLRISPEKLASFYRR